MILLLDDSPFCFISPFTLMHQKARHNHALDIKWGLVLTCILLCTPMYFLQNSSKWHFVWAVIIGSGITGASIARTLLKTQTKSSSSHPRVVMLEARSICSGATGCNGGHILETSDKYAELADVFGVDIARKMMRFRLSHLKEMLGVAEEWGLTAETQARKVRFLSVYFGEEPWKAALKRLARFQDGMPDESAEWTADDGEEIPMCLFLSLDPGSALIISRNSICLTPEV